ncbi:TcpD family membrane protein [Leuconostoc citreum]
MEFYNAIKPVLLLAIIVIAGGKAIKNFGNNETKAMWITLIVGGVLMFFINGPQRSLGAFDGLMNALLRMISGLGNGGG